MKVIINYTNIKVRYQETDKMGVVHHSVYPIWYEEGRTNFINDLNLSYSKIEESGIMLPLRSLNSNYINPALYEDKLTVRTKIKNLKSCIIEFEYKVYKAENLINTGVTEHPFVNKDFSIINLKKFNPELFNKLSSAFIN